MVRVDIRYTMLEVARGFLFVNGIDAGVVVLLKVKYSAPDSFLKEEKARRKSRNAL